MKKVLVTGGAGYIGSHFVQSLIEKGMQPIVLDNLSRGHREAVPPNIEFINGDLKDSVKLQQLLDGVDFDSVVHFAAFAYVGESVDKPSMYYQNNVLGTLNLLNIISKLGVKKFVFSSTCSIYGNPLNIPISESEPDNPINPYAKTKLTIEFALHDYFSAYGINYVALRYFNAAGAHPNSLIGESHNPEPHLIPIVLQAALGQRKKVYIYGDDYETADGTCIRDYIHVNDLAAAHIKALEYLENNSKPQIINLGTGRGYSVKEIITTIERVTGNQIDNEITGRREGDPAILVADNNKARNILGWIPDFDLNDIINTAWKWHSNPNY